MICNRGCDLGNVDSKLRISALSAFMHAILVGIIFFYVIKQTQLLFFSVKSLEHSNTGDSKVTMEEFQIQLEAVFWGLTSAFWGVKSSELFKWERRERALLCVEHRAASFFLVRRQVELGSKITSIWWKVKLAKMVLKKRFPLNDVINHIFWDCYILINQKVTAWPG